jgi:hypothetical protein
MNQVIIEVTTLRGGPVPGRVTATADVDGAPIALKPSSAREFTGPLPASGSFQLNVMAEAAPDFWADSGTASVTIPSGPGRSSVTLSQSGAGAITDASLEGTSPNLTLRVRIAIAKLRDVTADTPGMAFGSPKPAMHWDGEMMLNPSGTGAGVFRGSIQNTDVNNARFLVGKWRSNGIRIGIYLPKAGVANLGQINIFAKPPKHDGWTAPGIFGFYMFWGEPGDVIPKHLIAQAEAGGAPYILAMPAPEDGTALTYGNNQSGVLELAEEIDVLVRRKLLRQQAVRPDVKKIALTCFSRGAMAWSSVMRGDRNDAFLGKLRGIWLLDGHLDSEYQGFAGAVQSWQRGGPDRTIRIYASESKFTQFMNSGSVTQGPAGSWQWKSPMTVPGGFAATSYTFLPSSLWALWNPAAEKGIGAHQLIPNTCMSHALLTSGG